MIHEPTSWLQMRGTGHVAVVLHRKCPGAKQMQPDRLARRVKNADSELMEIKGNEMNIMPVEK